MERDRRRTELLKWLETTPILIAPVGATAAYNHDTLKVSVKGQTFGNFKAFSYSHTFNVFDLPVVTVPAGSSADGLPIGVQIVGRPYEEEMLLTAAGAIEEALGGWRRPRL
jgi:Asp-tRNA(Asn)/Glu-tRNA(Gln) amidotransferase A subunit family amidase